MGEFMNSTKLKHILIIPVLVAAFLIETFLGTTFVSVLPFLPLLAYIIKSIAFYAALFVCFLLILKPNYTTKSIIKLICIVATFWVFERIVAVFFFSEIFTLVYQIIRPLLIFAVVLLANILVLNSKIYINKLLLSVLCVLFVLGAVFNILEYIRIITEIQNMRNDFFSVLSLLRPLNSVYEILAKFCTYAFTFVLLIHSKCFKDTITN